MEPTPLISIGMPLYNAMAYLPQALDSILGQSFGDFELILSDNASTDQTPDICREYQQRDPRIRFFQQLENRGAAANFNFVFHNASAPFFKWAAHDDLLDPRCLELCLHTLQMAPPDVVLCFPYRQYLLPDGRLRRTSAAEMGAGCHDLSFAQLVRLRASRFPIFAFALHRRSAAMRTRLILPCIAADLIFAAEMRLQGRFVAVPHRLFQQRIFHRSPERRNRLSLRGEALWFSPRNQQRFPGLPTVRVFFEDLRAIHRCQLSPLRKLHCLLGMAGFPAARLGRIARRSFLYGWSCLSLLFVYLAPLTLLPLRCWALLAAARRRDRHLTGLAMGRRRVRQTDLLRFAACQLIERDQPRSDQLLRHWLTGGNPARRDAACYALRRCAAWIRGERFATVPPELLQGASAQARR